ncbi:MAG: UbiA family prenyltransferase [Myxococcota bacterium]
MSTGQAAPSPTPAPAGAGRPGLRDWLALCRVSNLPTVWMNALAALVLATGSLPLGPFALLVVSMSALYSAGMCWNDVFDRDIDAVSKPTRPIPSGRVSVGGARALATGLTLGALALLALTPHPSSVIPGLGLTALILLYDAFHKAHPVTVLAMAGCRVGVFVVAAWAVTGGVPAAVWIGAAASFAHTAGVTVVARVENARAKPFAFPAIPTFIAAMSITDGVVLVWLVHPGWGVAGGLAAALTLFGQRYVRGD